MLKQYHSISTERYDKKNEISDMISLAESAIDWSDNIVFSYRVISGVGAKIFSGNFASRVRNGPLTSLTSKNIIPSIPRESSDKIKGGSDIFF